MCEETSKSELIRDAETLGYYKHCGKQRGNGEELRNRVAETTVGR